MNKFKQTGFSIVELLIAMVISLTLIFACASVYSSLQRSIEVSQGLSTAQESLRTAHYLMARSIRQGQGMQLSGANPTRELTVIYGQEAEDNLFYGCLGNQQESGGTDTFLVEGGLNEKHLYCLSKVSAGAPTDSTTKQIIALDVQKLSADLADSPKKGVHITLAIKGMPGDMEDNGFKFSLAMRQRILIDAGVSSASASSSGLSTN